VPRRVRVRIEVPRGSFLKHRPDGTLDYASPLPCPFNYGSVLDTVAADGDPLDAIVLGPRIDPGGEVDSDVQAVVWIRDAGVIDDKLICSDTPLTSKDRQQINRFFRLYSVTKRALNLVRRRQGTTAFEGWADQERSNSED